MSPILRILLFIPLTFLGMGILIFVHELGHYLTARACKVTIYEFSLGMGKKLWGFKSKKTGIQYSLRLFPIGGYVSMAGEDEDKEGEEDDPNAFNKKNVWQRLLILVAGAGMNVITGALAMLILFVATVLLLKLAGKLLTGLVEKIPFVRSANTLLGMALGVLLALVRIFVFCAVVGILVSAASMQGLGIFDSFNPADTYLYRLFDAIQILKILF